LLCRKLAEVIHIENGQYVAYDFASWIEISELRRTFEPHEHDWIRTVRFEIAVPRILRLMLYDACPGRRSSFNRRNIYARDGNRCQYCGKKFASSELSLDHVVPRSLEGRNTWTTSCAAACAATSRRAGARPRTPA